MILSLSIAVRALRSRTGLRRAFLLAVIGGLGTACLLTAFSAASVRNHENDRAVALRPVFGKPGDKGLSFAVNEVKHRGRGVDLVQVADPDGSGVLPPGMTSIPAPGEVLVSPALARLIDDEPAVRAWFPGARRTTLPRTAVAGAGDLVAYLRLGGSSPRPSGASPGGDPPVVGFGPRPAEIADSRPAAFGWYPVLGCLAFLVLPAAALLLAGSRFGRGTRSQRFQVLRLLGLPLPRARLVLAAEGALPAAVGGALAVLLWPRLLPGVGVLPVTGRWFFGADARLPLPLGLAAVAVVALAGGAMCAVGAAGDAGPGKPGLRVMARTKLTGPAVALLFGAGLLLAAWAWQRQQVRDPLLWASIALLGVGLPSAATWTGQVLAGPFARVERGLVWLFATRRLSSDAPSRFRVAGLVGVAVFVVGAAQPVSQVLAQTSVSWISGVRADGETSTLSRAESVQRVPLPAAADSPPPAGVQAAVRGIGLWDPRQQPDEAPTAKALIADCAQLRILVKEPLADCPKGPVRLVQTGSPDAPPREQAPSSDVLIRSADLRRMRQLPLPTAQLSIASQDLLSDVTLVVPPDDPVLHAVEVPFVTSLYVRVRADRASWEAAQGWVLGMSPAFRLENSAEASEVVDSTGSWVLLGLMTAALVAACGAILTVVDDAARRREWFPLRAMGVPRATLVAVQLAEAAFCAVVTLALAGGAGLAVTAAWLHIQDERLTTYTPFAVALVAGAGAIVLVAGVGSWAALRRAEARRPTGRVRRLLRFPK